MPKVWLTLVSSELHKAFSPWLWHKETAESTKQTVQERLARHFSELDRLLAKQPYLTGGRFTVADACAHTIVNWAHFLTLSLKPYPALVAFLARVAGRPKTEQALIAEGLLRKLPERAHGRLPSVDPAAQPARAGQPCAVPIRATRRDRAVGEGCGLRARRHRPRTPFGFRSSQGSAQNRSARMPACWTRRARRSARSDCAWWPETAAPATSR